VMLKLAQDLIESLNSRGILYCHWKSNLFLSETWKGERDWDLLVARHDAQRFESLLAELRFKRAISKHRSSPATSHFYGMDDDTNSLVHVHAYYQIITGDSLGKNYRLPFERLLLEDRCQLGQVFVPSPPAELFIFVVRTMLKHTSLIEFMMLMPRFDEVKKELAHIIRNQTSMSDVLRLVGENGYRIDEGLFNACLAALSENAPFHRRVHLALKLRSQLTNLKRRSAIPELLQRTVVVSRSVYGMLADSRPSKQLATGGLLLAVVGPDAVGKSTVVRGLEHWLGTTFAVETAHLGRPPSTRLSLLPNLALMFVRTIIRRLQGYGVPRNRAIQTDHSPSLISAVRAVLLAHDRYRLVVRLRRQASNGVIVICDRYPSCKVGAMDSPRLRILEGGGWRVWLYNLLVNREYSYYRKIPLPDVAIQLHVPLEVAVDRDARRGLQVEPVSHLRERHNADSSPVYPAVKTMCVDANCPKEELLRAVCRIVWDVL